MMDVVDKAILSEFQNDLKGLTIFEAESELSGVMDVIEGETAWAEALSAYIRNDGELPE